MWKKIINRFKEPSTWAGFAGIAASFGLTLDPGMVQAVSGGLTGVFGALAWFIKEKGPQRGD